MQTALYQKYRPQKWSDVIGQDHVVSLLKNAIETGKVAHAYLFTGSRGTGKTSVARIFARELGVDDMDIYEIDAASHRGIDEIREIRDSVMVMPQKGDRKVYIIDEVHMLTKDAWNAFLKTLEEPPRHVVFVMATTEFDKVLETVVSRCQVFSFKKPNSEILKKSVESVAKKEGAKLGKGVSELIVMLSRGSFRDAYGVLQKVITISPDKEISLAEVEEITGAPRSALINDALIAISKKDGASAMGVVEKVEKTGTSMETFLSLLLDKMRLALVYKVAKKIDEKDIDEADLTAIKEASAGSGVSAKSLSAILRAYEETGRGNVDSLPFTIAIAEICESV